jgi:hypothetical protein
LAFVDGCFGQKACSSANNVNVETTALEGVPMPRKPNYQFDRLERGRQKAAKKAERLSAKRAKAAEKRGENPEPEAGETTSPPTEETED